MQNLNQIKIATKNDNKDNSSREKKTINYQIKSINNKHTHTHIPFINDIQRQWWWWWWWNKNDSFITPTQTNQPNNLIIFLLSHQTLNENEWIEIGKKTVKESKNLKDNLFFSFFRKTFLQLSKWIIIIILKMVIFLFSFFSVVTIFFKCYHR